MKGLSRILILLFSLSLIIFFISCPNPVSDSGGNSSGGDSGRSGGGEDGSGNTNEAPMVNIIDPENGGLIDEDFLPADVSMDANVFDPDGDPFILLWTIADGPDASVDFADATSENTLATFHNPGVYTLRLTADDGELTDSDDVIFTINEPGNLAPTVNAGDDDMLDVAALPPFDATYDLNPIVNYNGNPSFPDTALWILENGPAAVIFDDDSIVDTIVHFSTYGIYKLKLTVSDGLLEGEDTIIITINAVGNGVPCVYAGDDQTIWMPGTDTVDLSSANVSDDGVPDPPGALTTNWTKQNGPGSVTFGNANIVDTTATFSECGIYLLRLTASDSVLEVYDEVQIIVDWTGNTAPEIYAGADQIITLPEDTVSLSADCMDDALPAAATYVWTKQSGPGDVSFVDANSLNTDVSFLVGGQYVLRITAQDAIYIVFDELTVEVNSAPEVNAGEDQVITDTLVASLDGTVFDDNLPDPPGFVTTTWDTISGPGTVTFGDDSAVDTTATFSMVGEYVLRLSANDGDTITYDTVTIIAHNSPTVNAIADAEVIQPNSANLDGTLTDDALPAAATVTWSMVSGPGSVTFADANAVDTTAAFSTCGQYTLRITADDNYGSDIADVVIMVRDQFKVDIGNTDQVVESGWTEMTNTTNLNNQNAQFDDDFNIALAGTGFSSGFVNNTPVGTYPDMLADLYRTIWGDISITIQNLAAGDYRITLYSANTNRTNGNTHFDVSVNGGPVLCNELVVGRNEIADAPVLDSGAIEFTSDGSDVVITFTRTGGIFVVINGFILENN